MSLGYILGPLPGSLHACRHVENAALQTAERAKALHAEMEHTWTIFQFWRGKTRDAFAQSLGREQAAWRRSVEDLTDAYNAISRYTQALTHIHDRLEELEEDAHRAKQAHELSPQDQQVVQAFVFTWHYFRLKMARISILHELEMRGMEEGAILHEALHYEPNPGETGRTRPLTPEDFEQISHDLEHLSPDMVDQENIGDCYYLADLASILNSEDGRNFIRKQIKVHYDTSGKPDGFLVTLYSRARNGNLVPQQVFVQEVYTAGATYRSRGSTAPGRPSIASIYESAYAQIHRGGTMDSKDGGISYGFPGKAFEELTGREAQKDIKLSGGFIDFSDTSGRAKRQIIAAISEQRAVSLACLKPATIKVGKTPINLAGKHAYSVVAANDTTVTIRNPWGFNKSGSTKIPGDGVLVLSWDEFFSTFDTADISGSLK